MRILAARSTTISVTAPPTELIARLQAAGWEAYGPIPESLREYGVDALTFTVEHDGSFRILLHGLQNAYRPGMEIEGKGWFATDSSKNPVVHFELRPRESSIWSTMIVSVALLSLTGYNLAVLDPPNKIAYVLPVFVVFLIGWNWMQVRMLAERAWPGLLIVVKRLLATAAQGPDPSWGQGAGLST